MPPGARPDSLWLPARAPAQETATGGGSMATRTYDTQAGRTRSAYEGTADFAGSGWLRFAAILLGLAGAWNSIVGLLALGDSKVYGANRVFIFSDLRTWGWIVLGLGVLELLAAFAIFSGSELARWGGVTAASLNAIGQLAFVPVYPLWALTMFAVDVLVIYALVVYGGHKVNEAA